MERIKLSNLIFANKYTVLVLFVIINAPLVVFFFDYFNLNVTINGASYLYFGMNPYSEGSQIVAAYMILPYNLLAFILYLVFSFSVLLTYVTLKIIGLIFIYLTSLLIWKTTANYQKVAKPLLIGTIVLNPFLIINNDFSVSTTFIPIFFTLLSFYVLFESKLNQNVSIFIGAFALLIATSTYYFPILLLPSYLVYLKSNGARFKFLLFFITEAALLFIPAEFLHLSSSFAGTLVSGSAFLYPYSVFNLLPKFGQTVVLEHQIFITISLLAISLIFPFILKKVKISLPLSIVLVLLVSLLLQPSGTYPDSFLVLLPFEIIILIRSQKLKFGYLNSLIPQMFILPLFVIGELLNGPGYVTGIFYWLYTALYKNIVIYNLLPYPRVIWELLLVLTIGLALLTVIFLTKHDLNRIDETKIYNNNKRLSVSGPLGKTSRATLISLILIFFLIFPATVPTIMADSNSITMHNGFPYMLFTPVSNTGLYIMPSPQTYQYSGTSIHFSGKVDQLYLERNVSNQNFDFKTTISGYNSYIISTQQTAAVFASNQFLISLGKISNATEIIVTNLRTSEEFSLPYSTNINLEMNSSGFNTSVIINNFSFVFHSKLEYIAFGKLTQTGLSLTYNFTSIIITADNITPNFLLIILSTTIIGPTLLIIVLLQSDKRSRKNA